ncbi:GNAT family N-acetyltransferase [Ilumatobacteraceae bacterium]|nr:GNAT family N-acetyltransferase [Ilumatobacteraceae bacterium]
MAQTVPRPTDRLLLRNWQIDDLDAFAEMNADPVVMATIGPVMTRSESEAMLTRIGRHFEEHGFGLWCVVRDGEPVGFCGLMVPWFMDGVEIGWRLRSASWGQGFATEAARSVLAYAFDDLGLDEVVSFTAAINDRSQRVMGRIGLERDHDADFDHPAIAESNPLREHVLYRMDSARYRSRS